MELDGYLAEQGGVDLNSLLEELADWEVQLKPFEEEIKQELGGLDL